MSFEDEIEKVVEGPEENYPKEDSDYQQFGENNYDTKPFQGVEKKAD